MEKQEHADSIFKSLKEFFGLVVINKLPDWSCYIIFREGVFYGVTSNQGEFPDLATSKYTYSLSYKILSDLKISCLQYKEEYNTLYLLHLFECESIQVFSSIESFFARYNCLDSTLRMREDGAGFLPVVVYFGSPAAASTDVSVNCIRDIGTILNVYYNSLTFLKTYLNKEMLSPEVKAYKRQGFYMFKECHPLVAAGVQLGNMGVCLNVR